MIPDWDVLAIFRLLLLEIRSLKLEVRQLMTTDQSVAAVAADIETQVQALTAATAASTAAINAVLSEVANGTTSVSAETLAALQQAQLDLDNANAANTAAVAQETAESQPVTPPASS